MAGATGMPADANGRKSRRLGAGTQNGQELWWAKWVSKRAAHSGHTRTASIIDAINKREFH
jgi:hypothetical protein